MTIVPTQLPFLAEIYWQLQDLHHLALQEMLRSYKRGWHRVAEKLLANSDRHLDRSIFSRALIDLSIIRLH